MVSLAFWALGANAGRRVSGPDPLLLVSLWVDEEARSMAILSATVETVEPGHHGTRGGHKREAREGGIEGRHERGAPKRGTRECGPLGINIISIQGAS